MPDFSTENILSPVGGDILFGVRGSGGGADIAGFQVGSAAGRNVGITQGDLVELDANGKIPTIFYDTTGGAFTPEGTATQFLDGTGAARDIVPVFTLSSSAPTLTTAHNGGVIRLTNATPSLVIDPQTTTAYTARTTATVYFENPGTVQALTGATVNGAASVPVPAGSVRLIRWAENDWGVIKDITASGIEGNVLRMVGGRAVWSQPTTILDIASESITLDASHNGLFLRVTGAAPVYNIPAGPFPASMSVGISFQNDSTISAGAGVTLNGIETGVAQVSARPSSVLLVQVAPDEWEVYGGGGGVGGGASTPQGVKSAIEQLSDADQSELGAELMPDVAADEGVFMAPDRSGVIGRAVAEIDTVLGTLIYMNPDYGSPGEPLVLHLTLLEVLERSMPLLGAIASSESGAVPLAYSPGHTELRGYTITMTGSITLSREGTWPVGVRFGLFAVQDGTGGRTISAGSGVSFKGTFDGTINSGAGTVTELVGTVQPDGTILINETGDVA